MRSRKYFARERHRVLVTFIALLKLRLALCNKANYFDSCRPSMLHEGAVLNFDVKASKPPADVGLDIIFINIVYPAITRVFRSLNVIVLIELISSRVIEARSMKVVAEAV